MISRFRIGGTVTFATRTSRFVWRDLSSSTDKNNTDNPATASQTATIVNHFATLGVRQAFGISHTDLKNKYRQKMVEYHPDKQHQQQQQRKSGNNDTEIQERAAAVTAAYDCLKHPQPRALHLLQLLRKNYSDINVSMDDDNRNSSHSGNNEDDVLLPVDSAFLMQVMELREQVESAASGSKALQSLAAQQEESIQTTVSKLEQAFDETNDLEAAAQWTAHLQYYQRIQEAIREKSEE